MWHLTEIAIKLDNYLARELVGMIERRSIHLISLRIDDDLGYKWCLPFNLLMLYILYVVLLL